MGAAASLASAHVGSKTAGTQQEQQQKPRKQHQQQQDWASALGLILAHISEAGDTGLTHAERTLHRVNKQLRAAACATVRHLSLWQYHLGLNRAKGVWQKTETFNPAVAAAAAVPSIPWALLAASPSLTSLQLEGSQASQLTAGGSTTAAAGVQGGTCQVLAATLARLRCLHVSRIGDEPELRHVGWVLGHCTHLTKLVMGGACCVDVLREGLEAGAAAAAAAAEAAAAATTTAPRANAAGAAGSGLLPCQLPYLRHLELTGNCPQLSKALLSLPGVASQVTTVCLGCVDTWEIDWSIMAGCSGLQELVLGYYPKRPPVELPQELALLTGLTKLVLRETAFTELRGVVCSLKQLRILDLMCCRNLCDIPSSISQLQQLQQLDVSHTRVQQLPEELGTWLPKLEGLEAKFILDHFSLQPLLSTIPQGLTRLTRLVATVSNVTQASAVQHLVALKELRLGRLDPPFQPLFGLSALETLCIGWSRGLSEQEAAAVCIPGCLPNLRSLTLGGGTLPAGGLQLLVGAEQLTHLSVEADPASDPGCDQLAALWQAGVFPQLQDLVVTCSSSTKLPVLHAAAAIPWLRQQPQLTSLCLVGFELEGSQLEQLPCQLEELDFHKCSLTDDLPGVLTHLTRLHTLKMPFVQQVPWWLPYLTRSEVVHLKVPHYQEEEPCWALLAELPLLRGIDAVVSMLGAFPYVPHLCWSRPGCTWLQD